MEHTLITKEFVKDYMPLRSDISNKGTYGKVLNIAGSLFYQGAAFLASVSPLKVGAGLVTLASIEPVINNMVSLSPCVTLFPLNSCENKCIDESAIEQIAGVLEQYNTISIGPGLSTLSAVSNFILKLIDSLSNTDKKVVLDADVLNIIAALNVSVLPKNTVITPHPMELSRLIGVSVEDIQQDRIRYALMAVDKFDCTIVLKGHNTVVATPEKEVFINTSGNSALAKAGSGDVLTGIVSGLLAQGLGIRETAILGVYMHGLCGEIASETLTQYSVLSTDLIDCIPLAIKKILDL